MVDYRENQANTGHPSRSKRSFQPGQGMYRNSTFHMQCMSIPATVVQ